MDMAPTVGPDRNAPDEARPVKKGWIAPRLTVHGTLPALTFSTSTKTADDE
jgi:hypothetical protein